eukprot:gnl/Hemi2/18168_TR6007_c0_g1_i1.p2 gnl/Hemi2/18168_TR6007_c0_g1~~gnl/Hemi2/18168_TR6007_c0_g1_i1.p2  ORF type:complete len:215 (-),score=50.41 gnl/Hemi2/18168_TR6007_c0_g1_i1:61-705(-)
MSSAAAPATRGAFIVFEGVDRSGKSTQAKKLADWLAANSLGGKTAKLIRFPDRTTPIGTMINGYLSGTLNTDDNAIHLLFAANRWECRAQIESDLSAGIHLICDRYSYSGVAFSAAKGLDRDWCLSCERGLPEPDAVVYLDMPIESAATREGFGEERYETKEMQARVYKQYAALQGPIWKVIDARSTIEGLHEQVKAVVLPVLEAAAAKPIGRL